MSNGLGKGVDLVCKTICHGTDVVTLLSPSRKKRLQCKLVMHNKLAFQSIRGLSYVE